MAVSTGACASALYTYLRCADAHYADMHNNSAYRAAMQTDRQSRPGVPKLYEGLFCSTT
jgi:hypothetical protein